MNKIIETERLILRPLTIKDAVDVFEWVSDPVVNRYMPYALYESISQVEKYLSSLPTEANEASRNVILKCGFTFDHYGQYSRFDNSEIFDASFYVMHLD